MPEATPRARKKRTTVKGNLLKLAIVFLVFGAIAVAARVVNREPTLILPEQMNLAEDAARRASPDNALHALRDAAALLPAPTNSEAPILADWSGRLMEYGWPRFTPEINRFIHFDEVDLSAYIAGCTPAIDAAHVALTNPYFLQDEPDSFLSSHSDEFLDLATALLVTGAHAGRVTGEVSTAMTRLSDAVRLSRFLIAEDAEQLEARGIEEEALRQLLLTIELIADPAALAMVQSHLQELGQPWPTPYLVLERYWRKIDNSLSVTPVAPSDRSDRPLRRLFYLREIQSWATRIIPHKAFYKNLASEPVAAHDRMYTEYGAIDSEWRPRRRRQVNRNAQLLFKVAYTNLYYARAVIAVALEQHRTATGSYPESLDSLAPKWIPTVPLDPISGAPFAYHPVDEKYALYSVSMDGVDDRGNEERDLPLIMP